MNYFNVKLSSKETLNQLLKPFGRLFGFFSLLVQNISFWKIAVVSVWLWFISKMAFLEHHHNRFFGFSVVILLYVSDSSYDLTNWMTVETMWLILLFRLFNLASGADNPFLPLSRKINLLLWPSITHSAALTILFSAAVEILLCTAVKPHWTGQACSLFTSGFALS